MIVCGLMPAVQYMDDSLRTELKHHQTTIFFGIKKGSLLEDTMTRKKSSRPQDFLIADCYPTIDN